MAGVPGIGRDAVAGELPVAVVSVGYAVFLGQPVGGVIAGIGDGRGQAAPGQAAAEHSAGAVSVIGVGQATQDMLTTEELRRT